MKGQEPASGRRTLPSLFAEGQTDKAQSHTHTHTLQMSPCDTKDTVLEILKIDVKSATAVSPVTIH